MPPKAIGSLLAIASREIKNADLLAAKAELERQQESVKVEIGARSTGNQISPARWQQNTS